MRVQLQRRRPRAAHPAVRPHPVPRVPARAPRPAARVPLLPHAHHARRRRAAQARGARAARGAARAAAPPLRRGAAARGRARGWARRHRSAAAAIDMPLPLTTHPRPAPRRNYALENAMEASNLPLVELLDRCASLCHAAPRLHRRALCSAQRRAAPRRNAGHRRRRRARARSPPPRAHTKHDHARPCARRSWGIANAQHMMVRPDQLRLMALLSRKGGSGEVWRGALWGKQARRRRGARAARLAPRRAREARCVPRPSRPPHPTPPPRRWRSSWCASTTSTRAAWTACGARSRCCCTRRASASRRARPRAGGARGGGFHNPKNRHFYILADNLRPTARNLFSLLIAHYSCQVCVYKGFCVKGSYFCIVMKLYDGCLSQRISRAPGAPSRAPLRSLRRGPLVCVAHASALAGAGARSRAARVCVRRPAGGRLPLALAVKWGADIAKGLAELHRLGVVCADVGRFYPPAVCVLRPRTPPPVHAAARGPKPWGLPPRAAAASAVHRPLLTLASYSRAPSYSPARTLARSSSPTTC